MSDKCDILWEYVVVGVANLKKKEPYRLPTKSGEKEKKMKKIFAVLVVVLVASFALAVDMVSAKGGVVPPDCTVEEMFGQKVTMCYTDLPVLDLTKTSYTMNELAGLAVTPNSDSGILVIVGRNGDIAARLEQFYELEQSDGQAAYYPKDRCTKTVVDGKTNMNCSYVGIPKLVGFGPFSLMEATGLSCNENVTGGLTCSAIKSGLGTLGSMTKTGQVSGFYQVTRAGGDFVLYSIQTGW